MNYCMYIHKKRPPGENVFPSGVVLESDAESRDTTVEPGLFINVGQVSQPA